ncbi:hypothetical protein KFL_001060190 [Klebsormidium nitens]|uniref:Pro-apoptotic serine protease NMA111 n=1 Tax=Klebsormidium nitens TaxID=105231 RepID=A0A1Y1I0I9_KLENI|nr:hypothetical protein KFL_001060190 [Klebsormidium nitens]|eukprot:GAQ82286.1 hypothetical protein KFL_001060190 [Klebsormidium nitens]
MDGNADTGVDDFQKKRAAAKELLNEIDGLRPGASATAEDWRKALAKVVPAVVVLRITGVRAFDTESASSSYATGFIVDKKLGLILTNRHVVKPGPVVAEAVFLDREEIPVHPLYRDPVHDFGFMHFDPAAVQFMDLEEVPLVPEAATVGLEIRVVGNDSGEKVSILAGTLARLDRDAPHYKKEGFNDFNTFYIQAASGTKGGSSGSPVIDCHGQAVALNAGSKSTSASAFFLPLGRVVRALRFLQTSRPDTALPGWPAPQIPRGTLQTTLVHKGFDEVRRLGLGRETEGLVRASAKQETGMLVVDSVVPAGPAHGQLETGDVLVRVEGQIVTQFYALEALLDDSVGKRISVEVVRGGQAITTQLLVQNLHSITPDWFLELSGGVVHPLSYQQARNFRFPCGLVYVAEPGYTLARAAVPKHAVIKKFNSRETPDMAAFIEVLGGLQPGAKVPLEFVTNSDRHRGKTVLVTLDRHNWYGPPQIYTRDDTTGLWQPRPAFAKTPKLTPSSDLDRISNLPALEARKLLSGKEENGLAKSEGGSGDAKPSVAKGNGSGPGPAAESAGLRAESDGDRASPNKRRRLEGPEGSVPEANGRPDADGESRREGAGGGVETAGDADPQEVTAHAVEQILEPSFVMMDVHIPPMALLDGVHAQHFIGTGLIVHHSPTLGLVAVDRNTVPISVGDVMLSFVAYPVEIPAEVVFLHPVHNFAIVAYNPRDLGAGAPHFRAATLRPDVTLRRGDKVNLTGLTDGLLPTSRKSVVTNPNLAANVSSADAPRYRAMNMELIELDTDFGASFAGVLADDRGGVLALWSSFSMQVKYSDSNEDQQFVRGMPIYPVAEVLPALINGPGPATSSLPSRIHGCGVPLLRTLGVEMSRTLLSQARSFGLSEQWVKKLLEKDSLRRQVLRVKGCLAGSAAEKALQQGDMILAINGEPVTCYRDVEVACSGLEGSGGETLPLTVLRQGAELQVTVGTELENGLGTTRMVHWAGAALQEPHRAVKSLNFMPKEGNGVYISRWCHGSPVHRYALYALQWILEVNGRPTPNLDAFLAAVNKVKHGAFVRLKTVHLNGKPKVLSLKQDLHYWPTWELKLDPESGRWVRRVIKAHA